MDDPGNIIFLNDIKNKIETSTVDHKQTRFFKPLKPAIRNSSRC